jgi:hypothetical protein
MRYWTRPSGFGVGHGVNISTLQNVIYLETQASGWSRPKNGLKRLRRKEDSTVRAGRDTHAGQILDKTLDKALQVWGWVWG